MKNEIGNFLILIFLILSGSNLYAEISLDGTLGPSIVLKGPDHAISADLGQQRGNNLFHSFKTFNLAANESAIFSGPDSITHIISRVTGGTASSINGTLCSQIKNANLYFLNPSGIFFGPNARLDISGSFLAGTSDYICFSDQGRFNALPLENNILSAAPIESFGFLDNPGAITLSECTLKVPAGKTISLFSGNIDLIDSTLDARQGRINLASVGSRGSITLKENNIQVDGFTAMGDIILTQGSKIDVNGSGSGDIYIQGGSLIVSDNSRISSTNFGIDRGGEININLANDLKINNKGRIDLITWDEGNAASLTVHAENITITGIENVSSYTGIFGKTDYMGDGANISINALGSLTLQRGGQISCSTLGSGDAGNLTINAGNIYLDGPEFQGSGFHAQVDPYATGNGGNIDINTFGVFEITNGGMVNVTTNGVGSGGSMFVTTGDLKIDGLGRYTTGLRAGTGSFTIGAGGNISVETPGFIEIVNGGIIDANTSGLGNGGVISVNAGSIKIDGQGYFLSTGIRSGTSPFSSGAGGNIIMNVNDSIEIVNHGTIEVSTNGYGDGGLLSVLTENVYIDGQDASQSTGIHSNVHPYTEGNGGKINISANGQITLINGGTISSTVYARGDGGNIIVNAGRILVDGVNDYLDTTGFSTEVSFGAIGDGGNITLNCADSFDVKNNGFVSSSSFSTGRSGDIALASDGPIKITDNGSISSKSFSTGTAGNIDLESNSILLDSTSSINSEAKLADGGNISIDAKEILHLKDSRITTSVKGGEGHGGDIIIDPIFVILNDSQIIANAYEGDGGNIDLTTDYFFSDSNSIIEASSTLGINGIINIDTPHIDLSSSFAVLPEYTRIPMLSKDSCESGIDTTDSSLILTGNGSLPTNPLSLLMESMVSAMHE